jgi:protein-arginine kinase activator protein McsA
MAVTLFVPYKLIKRNLFDYALFFRSTYGKKSKGQKIFKKSLHERFTHLGAQNFITYGHRAAEKMKSETIKKQLSKHFKQLKDTIEDKKTKRTAILRSRGKVVKDMN